MMDFKSIDDLCEQIYNVLPCEFNAELVDGEYEKDTVKITKDDCKGAVYIGFDSEDDNIIDYAFQPEDEYDIPTQNFYGEHDTLEGIVSDIVKQFE